MLFEKPAEVGHAFEAENVRNFRNGDHIFEKNFRLLYDQGISVGKR